MSQSIVEPYLFFNGRCEEAMSFYRNAIGAKREMMMRFKDSPDPLLAESWVVRYRLEWRTRF